MVNKTPEQSHFFMKLFSLPSGSRIAGISHDCAIDDSRSVGKADSRPRLRGRRQEAEYREDREETDYFSNRCIHTYHLPTNYFSDFPSERIERTTRRELRQVSYPLP